ncbi:MAG: hypothetical protein DWQ47_16920 [Acidobacteria bacterium]|nr:MAG: hypothetical protein DWQ32_04320 [Acidobacteriota bacterium]REK02274.1 MAG: hypothetical protein DWQ38_07830 [Acidobacteriota bacterium]REK13923.1 MAG: hypothetical protein DWQ43_10010 [Acidobacteriota bacterium]REK41917.1 MAG: hypothetical protein DWQ47_16920 [Acidobacteriota bacterium]
MMFHPSGDTRIAEGDLLIVTGRAGSMQRFVNVIPETKIG